MVTGERAVFLTNLVILEQAASRWAVGCFSEKGIVNAK